MQEVFDDLVLAALHCRFSNCTHGSEPGCAVRAAIGNLAVPVACAVPDPHVERWLLLDSHAVRQVLGSAAAASAPEAAAATDVPPRARSMTMSEPLS